MAYNRTKNEARALLRTKPARADCSQYNRVPSAFEAPWGDTKRDLPLRKISHNVSFQKFIDRIFQFRNRILIVFLHRMHNAMLNVIL